VLSTELVAFPLSCKTGEGMDLWINWVEDELSGHQGE